MSIALLLVASLADLGLAVLLIAVSGFLFGKGPESMHGGPAAAAFWGLAILSCLAAPVAGLLLHRSGRTGASLGVASTPIVVALLTASGAFERLFPH